MAPATRRAQLSIVALCLVSVGGALAEQPYGREQFFYKPPDYKVPQVEPKVAQAFYEGARVYGLPSTDNLKLSENYILSYERRLKHPLWVLEHLREGQMKLRAAKRNESFFVDDLTLHEYFRSTNEDYWDSGYDRGHMAPAADNKASQRLADQSFCLSNVAPQLPGLNRGAWVRLETYVVHLARRSRNLYVVTGALYLPVETDTGLEVVYKVIGPNHVGVPTHFYKVILSESPSGELAMEAFLIANSPATNENQKISEFRVDILRDLPNIERASGLIFFDKLDRTKLARPTTFLYNYNDRKIVFYKKEKKTAADVDANSIDVGGSRAKSLG